MISGSFATREARSQVVLYRRGREGGSSGVFDTRYLHVCSTLFRAHVTVLYCTVCRAGDRPVIMYGGRLVWIGAERGNGDYDRYACIQY